MENFKPIKYEMRWQKRGNTRYERYDCKRYVYLTKKINVAQRVHNYWSSDVIWKTYGDR